MAILPSTHLEEKVHSTVQPSFIWKTSLSCDRIEKNNPIGFYMPGGNEVRRGLAGECIASPREDNDRQGKQYLWQCTKS